MLNRKLSAALEQWQQVYADQKSASRMGGGAIRGTKDNNQNKGCRMPLDPVPVLLLPPPAAARSKNSADSVAIELEYAEATTHSTDSQERMRVELDILRKYGHSPDLRAEQIAIEVNPMQSARKIDKEDKDKVLKEEVLLVYFV